MKEAKKQEKKHFVAAKYTKAKRPVFLVYFEELTSKSEALKREAQIKKLTKAKKEWLVIESKNLLTKVEQINTSCFGQDKYRK